MLHIWLPSQHASIFVWQSAHNTWHSYENWQSIADNCHEKKACLYFPSHHLLQLENNLSSKQLKQLGETGQQYLFEELSLTPAENLVVKKTNNSNHQHLFACSKNDIEQWQNAAYIVGIQVQALLPDFLLLPISDTKDSNQLYLYQDTQTTLIRKSATVGMAIGYLPLVLSQLDLVADVIILSAVDSSKGVDFKDVEDAVDSVSFIHSKKTLAPTPNPLRHDLNFAIASKENSKNPYLSVTVIVCIFALSIQIFVDGISTYQLKDANVGIQQNIQQQFQNWFPEQRLNNRTNVQPQLQPYLVATNKNDDAMSVFNRVSKIIKQSNTSVKEILIDDTNVKIQLLARNRNELDKVVDNMVQQGIMAQLGNINNLPNPIKGSAGEYTLVSEVIIEQKTSNSL